MKLVFASDLHGSAYYARMLPEIDRREQPERIVLLGDLLYHGPRNGVPSFYDPERVVEILNGLRDRIIAVRGNCDAEVDQAMFQFPMMSDYALLEAGAETFFLTHGHVFNERNLPPLGAGTVLAHGHTHVPELRRLPCGLTLFNPGSVSLPRGGAARSFGFFDGTELKHYTLGQPS